MLISLASDGFFKDPSWTPSQVAQAINRGNRAGPSSHSSCQPSRQLRRILSQASSLSEAEFPPGFEPNEVVFGTTPLSQDVLCIRGEWLWYRDGFNIVLEDPSSMHEVMVG